MLVAKGNRWRRAERSRHVRVQRVDDACTVSYHWKHVEMTIGNGSLDMGRWSWEYGTGNLEMAVWKKGVRPAPRHIHAYNL